MKLNVYNKSQFIFSGFGRIRVSRFAVLFSLSPFYLFFLYFYLFLVSLFLLTQFQYSTILDISKELSDVFDAQLLNFLWKQVSIECISVNVDKGRRCACLKPQPFHKLSEICCIFLSVSANKCTLFAIFFQCALQ
jgi:hypothetical protein